MSKKVKGFLAWYRDSLLPQYPFYHWLLQKPLRSSFLYFLCMFFLIYYIHIVGTLINPPQNVKSFFNEATVALKAYPKDLVIYLENNVVTSNYDHPVFLWNPDRSIFAALDLSLSDPKTIPYDASIIITSKGVFQQIPLSKKYVPYILPNHPTKITYATVQGYIHDLDTINRYSPYIAIPFVLVILPLYLFLGLGGVLFIISGITFLLAHLKNAEVTFKNVFKLTLHASTLPLILYTFLSVSLHITVPFFLFFLLLLFFSLCALYEAYGDHKKKHLHSAQYKRYYS